MSSETPDGDPPDDHQVDPVDSFFAGLRDADPTLRPNGGRGVGDPTRRGDGHRRTRPDRGSADGRPLEGSRGTSRPDASCPVTAAIGEAGLTVHHVGPPIDGRYGTERRVRTAAGRVDVRASRVPAGDDAGFAADLRRQHCRWATVSDLEGVVSVIDRGTTDRPWIATASTGPAVGGREPESVATAVRTALHLADALAALHERGVVHAGIDPGNVVFPRGAVESRPALTNVGLADVYRRYEDPAAVLDPRYAAPEYFGSEWGIVDRATDVYGLGAVCFRLFTGVAPVAGTPSAIADRVTADEPVPRPSRVEPRLPEAVDEVVRTATATDKFDRYGTAAAFRDALAAAAGNHYG